MSILIYIFIQYFEFLSENSGNGFDLKNDLSEIDFILKSHPFDGMR